MLKFLSLFFISFSFLYAQIQNYPLTPQNTSSGKFMRINILDVKKLDFNQFDGVAITELSALAYHEGKNENENILYALSDKGFLYHFDIKIKNNQIKSLNIKKALPLQDKKYKKLKGNERDSEGLVVVGDSLYISFERKHRVGLFTSEGVQIDKVKIHKDLKDKDLFRDSNKGFEAVALSELYGIVTAPEEPLRGKNKHHTLYAKNQTWKFKASGSITALEFIDNHAILVLERAFDKSTLQLVITLSKVYLDRCDQDICQQKILAQLDSNKGWMVDNFEGLTKVSENKYLMVSDDNGNRFQKTLLVLFEILD